MHEKRTKKFENSLNSSSVPLKTALNSIKDGTSCFAMTYILFAHPSCTRVPKILILITIFAETCIVEKKGFYLNI